MEHLRQLSVFESFPNTSTGFFRKLELPTLRALEYDTYGAGDSEFLPFTSLLTSVHHIQYFGLRIEHEPMPCEVIIAGLRLMPALRELAISFDWSIDSKFWTSITPTAQNFDPVLCPNLEIVKFSQFQATSDNELLEFIQARTGARFSHIASLSQAKVHFIRPRQIDILPALRQAVDDGLDFSLRYEHKPQPIRYSPSQENHAHRRGEVLSDHWDESWEYA
jgi:hypothetical protein